MINYFYDEESQKKIFLNNPIIEFFPKENEQNFFTKLWEDKKILDQHNIQLTNLYKSVISKLKVILNKYHDVEKSERYWEICLGYWLFRLSVNYFEKWKSLEEFLKKNNRKLVFFETEYGYLDFLSFGVDDFVYINVTKEFFSHSFNEVLRKINDQNIIFKPSGKKSFLKHAKLIRERILKKKNKNFLKRILFKKDNSNLKKIFYNTKINLFDSLLVNFKIGQGFTLFPNDLNLNDITFDEKFEPDSKFRSTKYKLFSTDIENFIFNKVIEKIPISFLENFKKQNLLLDTFNLPKNPKIIATANGFQGSTIYSQYIANKVEKGSKLYIFQHGGSYGQFEHHFATEYETRLADKYFTWGWKNDKEIPFYSLKKIKFYKKNKKRDKILLEIRSNSIKPKDIEISESQYQEYNYYTECLKFFKFIKNTRIEKDLLIKLSPRQFDYNEEKMFLNVNKNLSFADRNKEMSKIRDVSKLLIFTTISTGHLEAAATNYPFLVLNVYPDLIKDKYKHFFKEMKNLNILHNNAESLLNTIKNLPQNIDEWWQSNEIQDLLKEYISLFSRYDQKNRINLFCKQFED